ncbi:MAG: hypothetical protein IPN74_16840 [Haliscomenobacter sp.]|nr:hypothetical protein [Haliscomenobacter sp.]
MEDALTGSDAWRAYENELEKYEADTKDDNPKPIGENNPAVKALFGYALESDTTGARGHVILSDLYLEPKQDAEKVFSHVAIDRFTGGARDGMLFQQKAASSDAFTLDIYEKEVLRRKIKTAWEAP